MGYTDGHGGLLCLTDHLPWPLSFYVANGDQLLQRPCVLHQSRDGLPQPNDIIPLPALPLRCFAAGVVERQWALTGTRWQAAR